MKRSEQEQLLSKIDELSRKLSRLQELENTLDIGFWEINEQKKYWTWSDNAYTLFGLSPQSVDLDLDYFLSLIHKEDRDLVRATYINSIGNGTTHDLTYRIKSQKEEQITISDQSQITFDHSGRIILKGSFRDVSELNTYKRKVTFYQEALASGNNSLFIADVDGTILNWYSYAKSTFGFENKEVIGQSFAKLFKPDIAEHKLSKMIQKLDKTSEFSGEVCCYTKRKVERYIKFKISKIRCYEGNYKWIVFGKDITKKKQADIQAKQYRDLIEKTQEITQIGGWELNLETMEPFFTKELFKIYDLPGPDAPPLEEGITFYDPEHRAILEKTITKSIEQNIPYDLELKFISKTGVKKWVRSMGKPEYKNGLPYKLTGILQDITDRKKLELQLLRNNDEYRALSEDYKKQNRALKIAKDEAIENDMLKTKFLSNLSHEIRTPLNGIIGFSKLLQNKDLSNHEITNCHSMIIRSGEQLLNTVNDILEISSLESRQSKLDRDSVSISELLHELYAIFSIQAKNKSIDLKLNLNLEEEKNTIITDKTRLYKIISNLIQNALKFTVEGSIEIGCSMVDEVVQVYVKDTGVGIQKEMLTKIFERFTQEEESLSRKYGGLGLGLSIVKENAEIIKASIDVKSEKGKGSTFLVNIPYKPCLQTAKKFKSKNRIQQQTDKPYKIVIAEDADMNFIYLQMLLKKQDFNLEIHRAKNGLEAVELCRKHPNLDMLLMDIEMPKMDGYTAARNIRKENRLLKIIAQSAHAGSKDIHKAKELGFNDFIPKPIEEEKLLGILEKYLKQTSTTTSKQKLNS